YNARAQETADKYGITLTSVEDWYNAPGFIQYWSDQISDTYEKMTEQERDNAVLIVSAHSLPEKILKDGDPYPEQLAETAELITDKAGSKDYGIGWQSQGKTPDPWRGPGVQDLTREFHEEEGVTTFDYTAAGFVADHLGRLHDHDNE